MKQKKKKSSFAATLGRRTESLAVPGNTAGYVRWALYYCPVYRDLQADGRHINNTCTKELVVQAVTMITAAVILRFGGSDVLAWQPIKERMAHCSKCAAWWRNIWPECLWGP